MKNKVVAAVVGLLSFLYLINPGAGFIEFIPDNMPLVGNIDEGAAGALLLWAISAFRRRTSSPLPDHERADRS